MLHKSLREYCTRRGLLSAGLQCAFVLLAMRLVVVQVGQHEEWTAYAAKSENDAAEIAPQRGLILDRHGRKLAVTVKTWSIFANPRAVPVAQRRAVAEHLAEALEMDVNPVVKKLSQVETVRTNKSGERIVLPRYFVWIKRQVSQDKAVALVHGRMPNGKPVPGLGARPEGKRIYPNGSMLCHVLGFVGVDGQGLDGLEAGSDAVLSGTPGKKRMGRDGLGRTIGEAAGILAPVQHGQSLVLTIDTRIQQIVEEELAAVWEKHEPESACAIVMDPHTGDILAMANQPQFSPERFNDVPPATRRNMAVVDCLEPGSAFKPFIAASAIEHGVVTPDTRFNCHNGRWSVRGRVLHDAHAFGVLSVRDVIVFSSNIGIAQVGARLGATRLHRTLVKFGFGRTTGVSLAGESPGILRHPRQWSRLSMASISMGQEVACSPLQLVAGFCVFANGGWTVQPRILLGVADTEGRKMLRRAASPVRVRALSKRTADLMCKDLLAGVVERGTAKRCALSGYSMAGKTGTAQIARAAGGGYEPDAYTGVFVGIVPADAPRFVIGVVVKRPSRDGYYGGVVSAPAVARMAERILSARGIPRLASQRKDEEILEREG